MKNMWHSSGPCLCSTARSRATRYCGKGTVNLIRGLTAAPILSNPRRVLKGIHYFGQFAVQFALQKLVYLTKKRFIISLTFSLVNLELMVWLDVLQIVTSSNIFIKIGCYLFHHAFWMMPKLETTVDLILFSVLMVSTDHTISTKLQGLT